MSKPALERFEARTETALLVLAASAVMLYIADLTGAFAQWGLSAEYAVVALVLDACFVFDLLAKLIIGRGAYVRSPWILVDTLCALPILSTLALAPTALQGIRFVRGFRALRALRGLRSLWLLRLVQTEAQTVERRRFEVVLGASVLIYVVLFLGILTAARGSLPEGAILAIDGRPVEALVEVTVQTATGPRQQRMPLGQVVTDPLVAERYLVIGSVLGMVLVLLVARFQIPALWSERMRALLHVALPSQVAEWLLQHPDAYEQTVRGPATVVFCDIKGFTSTVELLPLEDVKVHLERALNAIVEAHAAHDLIIDKYIGDAVMSFRGGNLVEGKPEDHAWRVVRGALDGARALRDLHDPYFTAVKMGGASAENALIGTFGTSKRLSYTILGDRVNLAARLEGSCNALGVDNLFCDRTQALLADRTELVWRRVGTIRVQGKDEAIVAYEVFDSGDETGFIDGFHRALDAFIARRFSDAAAAFVALDVARPGGDALSRTYAELCSRLADNAPPADWEPVLTPRK